MILLPFSILFLLMSQSFAQNKSQQATLNEDSYVQTYDRFSAKDGLRPLDLSGAIEEALREGPDQRIRNQQNEILDVQWEGTKVGFWFPEVKMVLTSGPQKISKLRSGSKNSNPTSTTPTGSFGLELGDYTVYNWGKDYLEYSNKREAYNVNKIELSQARRKLRHDTIINFFEILTLKEVENIKKEYLRHASYLYRLNTEKLQQGKISRQEYHQTRALYLDGQQRYQEAQLNVQILDEKMAYRLSDEIGTRYFIKEKLDYREFKTPIEETIQISKTNSFPVLASIAGKNIAQRNYELAQKENLPLPKFSIDLGAYTRRFGPSAGSTKYETSPGNSNVELVAIINATWDLWGNDGFLNSRKLTTNYLKNALSEEQLQQSHRSVGQIIRQKYISVLNYQKQILVLEARHNNLQKLFDVTLDNYLNGKTSFINFSLGLKEMIEAQTELALKKFEHIKEKVQMATEMGVDDLPGENFEKLAINQ